MRLLKVMFLLLILLIAGYILYNIVENKQRLSRVERDSDNINIGWIGPLTGPVGSFGLENMKAVSLAVQEYDDRRSPTDPKINLVLGNDSYNSQNVNHEYQKMMAFDNPIAIIMLTYSGIPIIAPESIKDEVLIIDSLDNDSSLTNLNKNVFLIAKDTNALAELYVQSIKDKGKKHPAIIYNGSDDFMKGLAEQLSKQLNTSSTQTTLFEYKNKTTDFRTFLVSAKNKNADAYVFLGYTEAGIAMKQARDMGITAQFYAGSAIMDPEFLSHANGAAEGSLFVHFTEEDGNTKEAKEFIRKYQKKFRSFPTIGWPAMQSYDATNMLINAIITAHAKSGEFIDNLRFELSHTEDYKGTTGTLTIQEDGAVTGINPHLYIFDKGQATKYKRD